jgi:hypothetical protein
LKRPASRPGVFVCAQARQNGFSAQRRDIEIEIA